MIIFMGVAGSGKSVQGRRIADEFGLPWLSTGEFLRMLISGNRRKEMIAGKLLSDKDIINLIQKIFGIVDTKQEFVLDGFPRTAKQADWLLNQVKHGQLSITAVVHLQASEDVVKGRLLNRGRPDDHYDAIKERFDEYRNSILPILKHFEEAGVPVFNIDGEKSISEVGASIKECLQNAL